MTKKIENIGKSIDKQQQIVLEAHQKLVDLILEYNTERLKSFAHIMRSLPKDKSMGIVNFLVEGHCFEDCNDGNLAHAMPSNGEICERCAMLWLSNGNPTNIEAVDLLNDFIFGITCNRLQEQNECDDEEPCYN